MSAYLMKMKGTSEFRIEWKMRNVLESPGGFVKMQLFSAPKDSSSVCLRYRIKLHFWQGPRGC